MSEAAAVMEFETQHFTVRLDENLLKIDLRGSLKDEIIEAFENKPILKETVGGILGIFVPLHIRLTDIESVRVNETGKVKVDLPHRRDILIPLGRKDSEKLVDKLNELVPKAKKKEWERIIRKRRFMLQGSVRKHVRTHGRHVPPTSYDTMPWYFPTEQVDNVSKLRQGRKRKKTNR